MEKGGNSGNIGARKPILALGELLVDLVPGDTVNLENDVIGKYVEKLLRPQPQETAKSSLTLEFLAQHGF